MGDLSRVVSHWHAIKLDDECRFRSGFDGDCTCAQKVNGRGYPAVWELVRNLEMSPSANRGPRRGNAIHTARAAESARYRPTMIPSIEGIYLAQVILNAREFRCLQMDLDCLI